METSIHTVSTTVGELVEMLTQLALDEGQNRRESYRLASLTLAQLLKDHGIGKHSEIRNGA